MPLVESLSQRLKSQTQRAHTDAERSGIVRDLIRGQADKQHYLVFLKNLGEIYLELEHQLEKLEKDHPLSFFATPELFRYEAIQKDLSMMGNSSAELPTLPVTREYCQTIREAFVGSQYRLLSHAYVRYLGDLSGGQIMAKIMAKSGFRAGEVCTSMRFYKFAQIPDPVAYKDKLRRAIDTFGERQTEWDPIVEEANTVFSLNMKLSESVVGN